ncbi:hypothetical protein BD414DRAFT_481768 [Trametes punicea]|nr:hypothetical protein BD414DRAFT_481768 [Trametes punicea]
MRCPWSVPLPSAHRPPRVVANADQLVILNALYARVGQDATKDDIGEVSRETGLQEKWIRKWIKRKRNAKGGKGNSKASAFVTPSPVVRKPGKDSPKARPTAGASDAETTLHGSMRPVFDLHSAGPAWHTSLGQPGPASGSVKTSTAIGSPPVSEHSCSGVLPVSGSALAHTQPTVMAQGGIPASGHLSLTSLRPTTSLVQVAHPGDSFTVPLRIDRSSSVQLGSGPSSLSLPAGSYGPQSCISPDVPSPALGYDTLEFRSQAAPPPPRAPDNTRLHFSQLTPLHIPSGYPADMPAPGPGFSAPPFAYMGPSGFALGPGCLSDGAAYLYRLLNESSGDGPPPEAPPFHLVYYPGERGLEIPSPTLWSPSAFASPIAALEASDFAVPPTPVSYQMRMSDLVALTRSARAAALDTGPASAVCQAAERTEEDTSHTSEQSPKGQGV